MSDDRIDPLADPYSYLRRKTLASRCLLCGHSLVDAESVALGVGPDCRRRIRLTRKLSQRQDANNWGEMLSSLSRLVSLDPAYQVLVERAQVRLFRFRVTKAGDAYKVSTPYHPEFIEGLRPFSLRWLSVEKARLMPADKLEQVLDVV